MAHNRYRQRGGEDESTDAEMALLRSHGHEVVELIEDNKELSGSSLPRAALDTVWSRASYEKARRTIRSRRVDVLHVQNSFPRISPSVYYAARSEGVPVVQTLRNYRLLCPNALFFREGRVCEDCLGKTLPWPGLLHACYRDSRAATAPVAAMLTAHRAMGTWRDAVDVYVSLSEFARGKFVEGGLPKDRIVVKPNFVHPDPGPGMGRGGFALFVGRLSPEKGVDTLLDAWDRLKVRLPLKIVGDGPLADRVEGAAAASPRRIEWLGRRPVGEVYELMGEASVLVFPSEWYETFGRVAAEAFAKGTPVIAAEIGAISELVEHGRTGLRFRPGDAEDLARKVQWAVNHPTELARMRLEARGEYERRYGAEANYHRLMEIYEMAAEKERARG